MRAIKEILIPKGPLPYLILGVVILVVFLYAVSDRNGSPAATAASSGGAQISMVRGRGSDNSCKEDDADARIYVAITLRNSGDEAGRVTPWAAFEYSDGGHSSESFSNPYDGYSIEVPAHTTVDATFAHRFNPYQHSLIGCTGYTDISNLNEVGTPLG